MDRFYSFVIILTFMENIYSHNQNTEYISEIPLARSFGFSNRNYTGRLYSDNVISEKYLEQYNDIVKASKMLLENIDDHENRRLRSVIDDNSLEMLLEAVFNNIPGDIRHHSAAGRRRSSSQASRRAKLNRQSKRSNEQHSKAFINLYNV